MVGSKRPEPTETARCLCLPHTISRLGTSAGLGLAGSSLCLGLSGIDVAREAMRAEPRLDAPGGRFAGMRSWVIRRARQASIPPGKKPTRSRHMLTAGVLAVYFAYRLGSL